MSIFKRNKKEAITAKPTFTASHGPSLYQKLVEKAKGVIASNRDMKQDRLSHPLHMERYRELAADPTVSIAIDLLKDIVVPDFYFEMPEEATGDDKKKVEAIPTSEDPSGKPSFKPKTEPEKPKKKHPNQLKLEAWKHDTKATRRVKQIVGTMLSKGFCPVRIDAEKDYTLEPLTPEYFYIYRKQDGETIKYTQEKSVGGEVATWKPDDPSIALFINDEDTDHPYGEAITESLVELLDTRKDLNTSMGKIIKRFSSPLMTVKGTGDVEKIKKEVVDRDDDEGIFIGNMNDVTKDLDIEFHEPNPQVKFLPYIEDINAQIGQRLHAPLILMLKNATEASATKMLDSVERWAQSFQNELAENLEEAVFKQICGSGPIPLMRFGAPKEVLDEVTLTDINNCAEKSISKRQAQALIKQKGIELIDDEEFLNKIDEPPMPFGQDIKGQPFMQKPQKPKIEIPVEAVIENLSDLDLQLDIVEESFKHHRLSLVEACRDADKIITVHAKRTYGEKWQEFRDNQFQNFIHFKLVPKKEEKQVEYHVRVGG